MTTISTGRVQKYVSTAFQCSSPEGLAMSLPLTAHLSYGPTQLYQNEKSIEPSPSPLSKGANLIAPSQLVLGPTPTLFHGRDYLRFCSLAISEGHLRSYSPWSLNWSLRGFLPKGWWEIVGHFMFWLNYRFLKSGFVYLDLNFLTIQ